MSCNCSSKSENGRVDYQYAVKIVTGLITPKSPNRPLPPGDYKTKVNIHNPTRCDCIQFRWKIAVGFPGLKVGPVSAFFDASLCADEALEISDADIRKHLGGELAHIEGWVVIESPAELDVVAVYANAETKDGSVSSFHTERVPFRCLPVCDDFDLNVSSGVAAWQVKNPGSSSTFNVATICTANTAWNNQAGSKWICPGKDEVKGDHTYRLKFKLCSGFKNPILNMTLLGDDLIKIVTLNGQTIPSPLPGGDHFSIAPFACSTNQFFKTGVNELVIVVYNNGGPTGLNVKGSIVAANGLCPGDAYPLLPTS